MPMSNIVIVESPAKANTIKGYLGAGYKVMATVGHIRDLPNSKLGIEIENDFEPRYINVRGKADTINALKKEAKKAKNVYLATDPDREGEAISWHLAVILGEDAKKAKRVSFNEITKSAVTGAIKKPREIDMDLVDAQQARRILDRIVGYKISPILWKNVKSGLSAGRVQSVAVRLAAEREEEIEAFVSEEYWEIHAKLNKKAPFSAKFYGTEKEKIDIKDGTQAAAITAELRGAEYKVKSIKRQPRQKSPAPPFITSTLQQDAYRKLGFSSARTMKTAQDLYEGVGLGSEYGGVQGLITYMRTDSLRVADEASAAAKEYIIGKYGKEYYPDSPRVYKSRKNAQDAHEAIRPSNMLFEPEKIRKSLSNDQYRLYRLIWGRFVASQMASAIFDTANAEISAGKYILRAGEQVLRFKGYLSVYDEEADDSDEGGSASNSSGIAALTEGMAVDLVEVNESQHFTQPPPRYTEASLIKALEELGIGRPSTYATILTTIVSRGYVARENKALKTTPLGMLTTNLMRDNFRDIVDYKFTARMEESFDLVEEGKMAYKAVLRDFYSGFAQELEAAEKNIGKEDIVVPDTEIDVTCDNCGKKLIVKNGRFGKFAACPSYPECKFTVPLDREGKVVVRKEKAPAVMTDEKCDKCGSPMLLKTGRYGEFYACSAYPGCKNIKSKEVKAETKCPLCGGQIVRRFGKRKSVFYCCDKYPSCSFATWDIPIAEKCPDCGAMLLKKKGAGGKRCWKECGYASE